MDNLMGRYRNITIFGAVIIFQVLGLAIQIKRGTDDDSTRLIRIWTITAIAPLEKGIVRVQTGLTNVWHNYFYLRGVRQQNRELQEKIEQLQLEQVRLKQDADQAHRLQTLLGFKEQFIDKTIAAQVIGSSGSEQSRIVYLDKGKEDGIERDMPVISASGIVGKVIRALPSTAQVLLINDQNSGVGTILEQSRLQGVLKGRATGELVLDKIMSEEDVKVGDRVLTSGGDQIFPKGLQVGSVANVVRGTEFLQVTVRPAAALNHLEEVLVITKKQERQPQVAGETPLRAADVLSQRLPSVPDTAATVTAPATTASSVASTNKPAMGAQSVSTAGGIRSAAATAPGTKPPGTGAAATAQTFTLSKPNPTPAAGAGSAKPAPVERAPSTAAQPSTPSAARPAANTTQPPGAPSQEDPAQ